MLERLDAEKQHQNGTKMNRYRRMCSKRNVACARRIRLTQSAPTHSGVGQEEDSPRRHESAEKMESHQSVSSFSHP